MLDQELSDHEPICVGQGKPCTFFLSCIESPIDTVELTSDQEDSDHKTTSHNQSKLCIKLKVLLVKMSFIS